MLAALRTYVRLFVSSVMLLAAASFVLQGAADAGPHRHADETCLSAKMTTNEVSHVHAPGQDVVHAEGDGHTKISAAEAMVSITAGANADTADLDHASGAADACCGKFCSAAFCVSGPDPISSRLHMLVTLPLESQVGDGVGQSGQRRPPRKISIA